MYFRFKPIPIAALLLISLVSIGAAQQNNAAKPEKKKPVKASTAKDTPKTLTAEGVAESSIIIFGGLGGRNTLDQIRKTALEKGKTKVTNAEGRIDEVSYEKRVIRGASLNKERIRLDQEFPNARYSLVYADEKTFGIFNDSVFTPRADATRAFENQIFHGLEALLRYKESESKLELGGHEKIMGVDLYFVDVTDKAERKTRYYISSRTFRVIMLEYEDEGVKYRRRFYDYNYAQGTLVPFRSTLTANDKVIEENEVSTVTFGQKVDEDLFKPGS